MRNIGPAEKLRRQKSQTNMYVAMTRARDSEISPTQAVTAVDRAQAIPGFVYEKALMLYTAFRPLLHASEEA